MKVGLWDHHPVCVSVNPPPFQLLNTWTNLNETWYVYDDNKAHLNGILHKCLPSVCICTLLGNGSVKTLPWQRIHAKQQKNCWKRRFLCSPCHIKGTEAISFLQNFLFVCFLSSWIKSFFLFRLQIYEENKRESKVNFDVPKKLIGNTYIYGTYKHPSLICNSWSSVDFF
jgi:hypothetical protein